MTSKRRSPTSARATTPPPTRDRLATALRPRASGFIRPVTIRSSLRGRVYHRRAPRRTLNVHSTIRFMLRRDQAGDASRRLRCDHFFFEPMCQRGFVADQARIMNSVRRESNEGGTADRASIRAEVHWRKPQEPRTGQARALLLERGFWSDNATCGNTSTGPYVCEPQLPRRYSRRRLRKPSMPVGSKSKALARQRGKRVRWALAPSRGQRR
jgi:hypothetical protein